ncbi:hypothetical protein ACWIUD_06285 [Helicobacter sp. 23-1044]
MSFASALKSAFLPTLFARSCDILAFKSDPYALKSRVVGILSAHKKYSILLNFIAKIPHTRIRYAIFLLYFAPNLVALRAKNRLKKALGIMRG